MRKKLIIIVIATLSILLANCAPNLRMVVDDPQVQFANSGKIIYIGTVTGGQGDSFWMGARIDKNEFRNALIGSAEKSGLFQLCPDTQSPHDYELTARIMSQDQPAFGFNMTTTLKVKYTLKNTTTNEIAFDKLIISSFTATPSDAFIAAARLNAANAGAVRENIKQILTELSTQNL